jgi:hypothetical protein
LVLVEVVLERSTPKLASTDIVVARANCRIEPVKKPEENEELPFSSGYGLHFTLRSSFGQHEMVISLRYLQ